MDYKAVGYKVYLSIIKSELATLFRNNFDSKGASQSAIKGLKDILSFCYIRAAKKHLNSTEFWIRYSNFLIDTLNEPKSALEKISLLKSRI